MRIFMFKLETVKNIISCALCIFCNKILEHFKLWYGVAN
jgi:hypothetical protein